MKTTHIVILGQPGCGKSYLASIISKLTGLTVTDEIGTVSDISENPGIYVSNTISKIDLLAIDMPAGSVVINL